MPYEPHKVFTAPRDGTPIWRYIDFTKLVSMLVTRTLFFCRSDLLDDRFEGSMPQANARASHDVRIRVPAADGGRDEVGLAEWRSALPKRTYINSWSIGRYESVALWRLYVGERDGVALRSSFGRLTRSLQAEPRPVHIGQVRYIDYETDRIPDHHELYPFVHKRKSFDFERELRAVIQDHGAPETPPRGILAACDLQVLVSAIRVSPASGAWFAPLVRSVLKTYGLEVPVEESNLLASPVY
jgi:hypothetical protein